MSKYLNIFLTRVITQNNYKNNKKNFSFLNKSLYFLHANQFHNKDFKTSHIERVVFV